MPFLFFTLIWTFCPFRLPVAAQGQQAKQNTYTGSLKALAGTLGLLQRDPQAYLQNSPAQTDGNLSPEAIEELIAQRNRARAEKNWAESDRIRDLLAKEGITLRDSAGKTVWTRS